MNLTDPAARTIRATMSDDALRNFTRIYAASLDEIIVELAQNARRGGATRVAIRSEPVGRSTPPRQRVTVCDDGHGIQDPSVLLCFGASEWKNPETTREAPAGMGMLSLAHHGAHIAWRCTDDPAQGWECTLAPEHFTGAAAARIEPCATAPDPHGTHVTFEITATDYAIEMAAHRAGRYLPIPMSLNARNLEQSDFLAGAKATEEWNGIRIGVLDHAPFASNYSERMTLAGMPVAIDLPEVRLLNGERWYTFAEILDAPDLELVLPSRREVVQSAFRQRLIERAERFLFEILAIERPKAGFSFDSFQRARDLDVPATAPAPALTPWLPLKHSRAIADDLYARFRDDFDARTPVPLNAIVVSLTREPAIAALHRAAVHAGFADRLFFPCEALAGYAWYDALPRIDSFACEVVSTTGVRTETTGYSRLGAEWSERRIARIIVRIGLVVPETGAEHEWTIDSDAMFWEGDANEDVNPAAVLTDASTMTKRQLSDYLRLLVFNTRSAAEREGRVRRATAQVLLSEKDALRSMLKEIASEQLLAHVPEGVSASVRLHNGKVSVRLSATHVETAPQPALAAA